MKRFFLSAVFAVGFGGAACGQTCVWPSEKTAFEVIGLKNVLMVAALSCRADDSYNQFMAKFQAALLDDQGVVDRYFVRAGGLAGQQQEDGYMTRIANEQSGASLAKGAAYCASAATEFHEVLGLPDEETLTAFAAGDGDKDVAAMAVCNGTAPPSVTGGAGTIVAARKPDGAVVVADPGKGIGVKTASAHAKHKAIVKAPAKPVVGLVQV
jgi:Tfp pilus assembly protein PilE